MTGWCPIDGEVCRHDGYCRDCPIHNVCEQTEQKGNLHCLRKIADMKGTEQ